MLLNAMYRTGAVPVITVNDPEKAVKAAQAMYRGGTEVVELTMRVPGAAECIDAIRRRCPEIAVGAGTVLTCAQLDEAKQAGAMFAVAPGYDEEVVAYSQAQGIFFIPGLNGATDIQKGIKAGLTLLKFFPAEPLGGLRAINYLSEPFPMVRFLPAAGVGYHNLADYLAHPAVHCCAGGFMCRSSQIEQEDWASITALCARVTAIARQRPAR